jgi:uncharacterized protein YndB with AHSA1/START domain
MNKEKIRIEYPLKGSANMIWRTIGTPQGLSIWFADRVEATGKLFDFYWGKTEHRRANLIAQRNGVYVRFRWEDDDQQCFFEMRITYNEMVRQHMLEITDFADKDEVEDTKSIWDSQMERLCRATGM